MKIPRYGKLSARLRELGLSQTDLAYALRLSPGAISQRMQGTFMAYAQMCVDDAVDDPEIVYTKEKMDRALRAACGENIRPFEERYAIENLYFREKLKEKSHE